MTAARRGVAIAGIAGALALMIRCAFPMAAGLDYWQDASAPIDALARGDLHGFAASPALMGNFSLFLRAPFVALVFQGSLSTVYFVGVVPCLAAVVVLALVLRRLMLAAGRPAAAAALVACVALVNPGIFRSVHWGHPEEFLAGALAVLAVIAATRGRCLLSGVLLGLALATKQWALIAVIPTLLAAPHHRPRLLAFAAVVAVLITLPSLLAAPHGFVATNQGLANAAPIVTPVNVWWPISHKAPTEFGHRFTMSAQLSALTHPAIVLAALPLGFLFWRRRRELAPEDALGLLALLMLLRCVLDPWNNDYYHVPFLLALLAWEALARDGWPRATLLSGAALALIFPTDIVRMSSLDPHALRYNVLYLAWGLSMGAWLAMSLFAPGALSTARERLLRRRFRRDPAPLATVRA